MQDTGITGYIALGADINKPKFGQTEETQEGVVSEKLPELTLEMEDDEIVALTQKWQSIWDNSAKKQEWEENYRENEKYWLGKHFDKARADKSRPLIDNLIFESLETYLPQTTRRNPEPLVAIHSTSRVKGEILPAHEKYLNKVKDRLVDLADENKVRLKLKKAARHWAIYLLGVAKYGWDLDRDIPTVRIIRPTKIILDPDATIDEDGYTGDRVGEYRKLTAQTILDIIDPDTEGETDEEEEGNENKAKIQKAKDKIKEFAKDKEGNEDMATEIQFIEWWTPQFFCWKLDDTILLKRKNPHWNYDREEEREVVDEFGNTKKRTIEITGKNHLPVPMMPYSFLSVFNLGDQPMDKTSLIGQNLAQQDMINKRNRQIDKNVDRQNSGMVVSLSRSGLTKPQAEGVSSALAKGGTVVIPDGAPRDAVDTYNPGNLPSDVFSHLFDARTRMRDIFGTSGSTPAGVKEEDTVRGKIQSRSLDTDRIGGGVSEYLEQFSDEIYNWFVQLLYVYDDAFQFTIGTEPPKLNVSVKEGSLLPKDSIAIANQAMELAGMNRLSTLDLYKRLEYPNPEEMAANVWLEQNAPHLLYRENELVQQAIQAQQQAAQEEAKAASQEKEQEAAIEVRKEQAKQAVQARANVAEETGEEIAESSVSRIPIPRATNQ